MRGDADGDSELSKLALGAFHGRAAARAHGAHCLGLVWARDRHHTLGQRPVQMPAQDLSLPRLAHALMALAQLAVQGGALGWHCGLGAFTYTHLRLGTLDPCF
ncbi:hypothetical protein IHE45_15G082800 [Dioscorea alata]|uniref:Uncharacterized protein n=1 Tax=Dioscorea alata TaxID=55571 RepID=A0ACB7UMG7_DIOAL|nr:hypothetical protein IHE45_15G082800 [Dioscorea alata]